VGPYPRGPYHLNLARSAGEQVIYKEGGWGFPKPRGREVVEAFHLDMTGRSLKPATTPCSTEQSAAAFYCLGRVLAAVWPMPSSQWGAEEEVREVRRWCQRQRSPLPRL
jgi:hypothetical protein